MKGMVELVAAAEKHRVILKNMFQLYLHDLSAYTEGLDIN